MIPRVPLKTSHQLSLIVVPPFFLGLATIILALRFWARKVKKQRWGLDDWLCLAALFVTYVEYGALVAATVWGGHGVSIYKLTPANISFVFKPLLAISLSWGTAVAMIQFSILALYVRVFQIVTWMKWTSYALMALVFVWWASYFVTLLVACIPLKAFWTPGIPATCIDMKKFASGSTASHIILDILLILIVLPVVWRLNTNTTNKITVSVALALGVFATVCAVLRFAIRLDEWNNPDATGTGWIGSLLEVMENASAVICSSLPVMAFLLSKIGTSRVSSSIRRLISRASSGSLRDQSDPSVSPGKRPSTDMDTESRPSGSSVGTARAS